MTETQKLQLLQNIRRAEGELAEARLLLNQVLAPPAESQSTPFPRMYRPNKFESEHRPWEESDQTA